MNAKPDQAISMSAGFDSEARKEALNALNAIFERQRRTARRDTERDHIEADQILLNLINDPVIALAFDKIDKYYA